MTQTLSNIINQTASVVQLWSVKEHQIKKTEETYEN